MTKKETRTVLRLLFLAAALVLAIVLAAYTHHGEKAEEFLTVRVSFADFEQEQILRCQPGHKENELWVFLPAGTQKACWDSMELRRFTLDGEELTDGQLLPAADGQPHTLTEKGIGGLLEREYTLRILQSENLASVHLSTQSGSMDYILEEKGNEEEGQALIAKGDGRVDFLGDFSCLRGRGNYTWLMEKKSFSLQFLEQETLLSLGQDSEWVLLASASEDTHLINRMVFELMRDAGILGVQNSTWVDLYLNGEYMGNYLLSQKVKPREEVFQGWMVEFDGYWKEEGTAGFETAGGEAIAVKIPEDAQEDEVSEIARKVQQVENAVLSPDGTDPETGLSWQELADADSLVKKYVLDEISLCPDGWNGSNYCFLREGKMYFGSPWDYEFSFGNQPAWFSHLKVPYGLYHAQQTPWYAALYEKTEFLEAVRKVYESVFRPWLTEFVKEGIDGQAGWIGASMRMDAARWGAQEENFGRKIRELKEYIEDRLRWLDEEWLGLEAKEEETPYHALRLMDGDSETAVYYIRDGEYVDPDMLVTDDRHFTGWYEDEACSIEAQVLSEPVTGEIVLYAGWDRLGARAVLAAGLTPLALLLLVLGCWILRHVFEGREKSEKTAG